MADFAELLPEKRKVNLLLRELEAALTFFEYCRQFLRGRDRSTEPTARSGVIRERTANPRGG